MGIGHVFIIWILSASLQPPYSSVDPTGLVVPIALITLLNRNAEVKVVSTTTTTTTPPPSEVTTNVLSTTMISGPCITCQIITGTSCPDFGCAFGSGTECVTIGNGPPVTLTCGQMLIDVACGLFDCDFDENAGTCGPSDQEITCSQFDASTCLGIGAKCCTLVDGECVEI